MLLKKYEFLVFLLLALRVFVKFNDALKVWLSFRTSLDELARLGGMLNT